MAKKTDEERLKELEEKIEQARAKKQLIERRVRDKERRERTRRLIQVGAIFEKYFGIEGGEEEAEQIAWTFKDAVEKNKEKVRRIDIEKTKEQNQTVYKEQEEKLVIPNENEKNPYQA